MRFSSGLVTGLALAALIWATGLGIAPNLLERLDKQGINAWREARETLMMRAAADACVTPGILSDAAESLNWTVKPHDMDTRWTPQHLSQADTIIRIHVMPPLPFDKDPGDLFGFDAQGCLVH